MAAVRKNSSQLNDPDSVKPVYQDFTRKLSNEEARELYNSALKNLDISGIPDRATAQKVVEARNALKQVVRDAMADTEAAKQLAQERPLQPLEYYEQKYSAQGYQGDALYLKIIEVSTKANQEVNAKYQINEK